MTRGKPVTRPSAECAARCTPRGQHAAPVLAAATPSPSRELLFCGVGCMILISWRSCAGEPFHPFRGSELGAGCGEAVQGTPARLMPRCASPGSLEQLVSPVAFPASSSLDPCAKETVLNAIKESRKRAVEREEEEEDQAFGNNQESKRR